MLADEAGIGERTGNERAVGVPFAATVADVGGAQGTLDDAEGVFDLGPDLGVHESLFTLACVSRTLVAIAAVSEVLSVWGALPDNVRLASVSLITPDPSLLSLKKAGRGRGVMDSGGGHDRRADDLGFSVNIDVDPPKASSNAAFALLASIRKLAHGKSALNAPRGDRK